MPKEELIINRFRLALPAQQALKRLGLHTLEDLLLHLPAHYGSPAPLKQIAALSKQELASVYGQVTRSETKKAPRRHFPIGEITIADESGSLELVWFHQAFLAKKFKVNDFVKATGVVSIDRRGRNYFANPEIEAAAGLSPQGLFAESELTLLPVYSESRGISSLWFRHAIQKLLREGLHRKLADPLPEEIKKKFHLPSLSDALLMIHAPRKEKDSEIARKRFAFEEIFLIQLERLRERLAFRRHPNYRLNSKNTAQAAREFAARLPFTLTSGQKQAVREILADFEKGSPMLRLLEGDVGSGKTAVAAITAYAVAAENRLRAPDEQLQIAYMAPTEILAKQHFAAFIKYFAPFRLALGLATGGACYKFPGKIEPQKPVKTSKNQFKKWVGNGEIPIVFGTHALIQKSLRFKNLAYVIVDEQHRFGVAQREALSQKSEGNRLPHFLSMTATPIPRTLALTIYGDLDLSLLEKRPSGRQRALTKIIPPTKRKEVYDFIRETVKKGSQGFIVCPRVQEPDPEKELALRAKSVEAEWQRLKKEIFPDLAIGFIHGKMKVKEKDAAMMDFKTGRTALLVATSVVEVGVDVPKATVMLVEGAERFGLSQLHQLRGRVERSSVKPHCFLFTESSSQKAKERLKALVSANDGFALAELDLSLRGPGELSGKEQWGVSDIGMEALKNLPMVSAARQTAAALLEEDPLLKNHPLLKERLRRQINGLHLE